MIFKLKKSKQTNMSDTSVSLEKDFKNEYHRVLEESEYFVKETEDLTCENQDLKDQLRMSNLMAESYKEEKEELERILFKYRIENNELKEKIEELKNK